MVLPLSSIGSIYTFPFQQVSYNLIINLPSSSGFDMLLVMVNHRLIKRVIHCPTTSSMSAECISSHFFNMVFFNFGLYDKIISDESPQFASAFTKELRHLLSYDLALFITYHH